MEFRKATKQEAKARIGLAGPAGSGKTYTALRLATAMCKRVAVVDTEHGSASKYADEFDFDVLELTDFHPNNYIKAIQAAEAAGYDGLIIDSISHEWNGKNGCLELVELYAKRNRGGNKYAAWADVTPLHNSFIEAIHASRLHIIATMRSKMDYLQTEDDRGKTQIKKVGMAPITREGAEYEFDIVGEIGVDHTMVITKSRCKALADQVFCKPGEELAQQIMEWLSDGVPAGNVVPITAAAPQAPTIKDQVWDYVLEWAGKKGFDHEVARETTERFLCTGYKVDSTAKLAPDTWKTIWENRRRLITAVGPLIQAAAQEVAVNE